MNLFTWTALGFGILVAIGIGLFARGSSRWQAATKTQMSLLEAARVIAPAGRYDAREIDGLPAPVQRYFAEMAWYPTALLPSQGVIWAAVDDRSANATLVDDPISLTLRFRFDEAGLITSVRADARGSGVGKDMVMLPWDCSVSNYQPRDGIMVPTRGEAAWLRPEGRRPYFVGDLTSLVYEFAP